LKPKPLPSIICISAPSAVNSSQIAEPSRCIGIDTVSTVAPTPLKALRGITDDSIDLRQRLRMGEALLDRREPEPGSVSLQRLATGLGYGAAILPGVEPVRPANTSSNRALSSTVAVIGPV